jgi:hypothetical protein
MQNNIEYHEKKNISVALYRSLKAKSVALRITDVVVVLFKINLGYWGTCKPDRNEQTIGRHRFENTAAHPRRL